MKYLVSYILSHRVKVACETLHTEVKPVYIIKSLI